MYRDQRTIYQYRKYTLQEVVVAVAELVEFGKNKQATDLADLSVWSCAIKLNNLFASETAKTIGNLSPLVKSVIGLLDVRDVKEFISIFKNIETEILGGEVGGMLDDGMMGEALDPSENPIVSKLVELDLSKVTMSIWTLKHSKLNQRLRKNVEEKVDRLGLIYASLLLQLTHICTVVELFGKEMVPYTPEEFDQIFFGELQAFDTIRLTKGYLEVIKTDDSAGITKLFLAVLAEEGLRERAEYDWEGIFFLTLAIHAVYEKFKALSSESQKIILDTYLYRAIFLDVPVRQKINDVLDDIKIPVEKNKLAVSYVNIINASLEWVAIKPVGEKLEEGLSLLLRRYRSYLNEHKDSASKDEFLDSIYGKDSEFVREKDCMRDLLGLYDNLLK